MHTRILVLVLVARKAAGTYFLAVCEMPSCASMASSQTMLRKPKARVIMPMARQVALPSGMIRSAQKMNRTPRPWK